MPEVVEDAARGVVIVGGRELDGHVDDRPCPACGEPRIYYDDFDAFFCARCDSWLESACCDAACDFCRDRPGRPLAGVPLTK